MTEKITDVAVAVLLKDEGYFLLSSRPEGKPYAGYWEFPGGKVEPGESVEQALKRELAEELGICITHAQPWFTYIMRYTHATVRLHAWRVRSWDGILKGLEGQQFIFQQLQQLPTKLDVAPTLPGCVPIFKALQLPTCYAITAGDSLFTDVSEVLKKLKRHLQVAPLLLQIREKNLALDALRKFANAIIQFRDCHNAVTANQHKLHVLLNVDSAERIALAQELKMDGLHLQAAFLAEVAQNAGEMRRDFAIVGASIHDIRQLAVASKVGCDFAVLGHVLATPSHPQQAGLGWDGFAAIAMATPIPVYAIGGLALDDLTVAQNHGAHGVAMIRAAWR